MKHCPRCGISKPATPEFFYRNCQTLDGLQGYCKVCKSEIHKLYMNDPDTHKRVIAQMRAWQTGVGKEKYKVAKLKYDKSEKRKAWRRERTARAKANAEEYIRSLEEGREVTNGYYTNSMYYYSCTMFANEQLFFLQNGAL